MNHQFELSTDEKEMMRLYIVEGLSVKEIAAKKEITTRATEKRIEKIRVRWGCISIRQLTYRLIERRVFSAFV